jgi:hypothetical protein
LGTIWFYALLVNAHQTVEAVRSELDRHLTALSDQDPVFSQTIQTGEGAAVFAPENIFWDPASKQVGEKWHRLWRQTLDIGGSLLAAALQSEHKWSPDKFWLDFNTLRADIKIELFGQEDRAAPAAASSEDPAIADILIRLHAKWRREMQPPTTPPTENDTQKISLPGPQETGAPDETRILAPGDQLKSPLPSDLSTSEEETLILPSYDRPPPPNHTTPSSDDQLIQETVILSPGNSAPQPPGMDSITSDKSQEDLPETVVLTPRKRPGDGAGLKARTSRPGNQPNTGQQPGGDKIQPPMRAENKEGSPQDDDILTETVVLRPAKGKGLQNE